MSKNYSYDTIDAMTKEDYNRIKLSANKAIEAIEERFAQDATKDCPHCHGFHGKTVLFCKSHWHLAD